MHDAPITTVSPARTVRLVLGDQLNASHPWWSDSDDQVLTVMMECRQETDYAQHHVQKVLAFFLAMRRVPSARHVVTTAGNPSGIAATASATAILK